MNACQRSTNRFPIRDTHKYNNQLPPSLYTLVHAVVGGSVSFQAAGVALLCRTRCYAIRTSNAIRPSTRRRRSVYTGDDRGTPVSGYTRAQSHGGEWISLFVELSFLRLSRSFTDGRHERFDVTCFTYSSRPLITSPRNKYSSNYRRANWPSKINCHALLATRTPTMAIAKYITPSQQFCLSLRVFT